MKNSLFLATLVSANFALGPRTLSAAPQEFISNNGEHLSGTKHLKSSVPLSDRILDGTSLFLDRQLAKTIQARDATWASLFQQAEASVIEQLESHRQRLRYITGCDEPRAIPRLTADEQVYSRKLLGNSVTCRSVYLTVLENYTASGMCITGNAANPSLNVIWIPDTIPSKNGSGVSLSAKTTEDITRLAEAGARVFIIYPFSNTIERRGGRIDLTDREYVYRTLFVLGRHPVGMEVQCAQSLVDWLDSKFSPAEKAEVQLGDTKDIATTEGSRARTPICIVGEGDSGLSALIAAATDTRFDACVIRGDFGNRDTIWSQPITRNIFDFSTDCGDAQLACLVRPRTLIVDPSPVSAYSIDDPGAAPGRRISPTRPQVDEVVESVKETTETEADWIQVVSEEQTALDAIAERFGLTPSSSSQPIPELKFPVAFRDDQLRQIENLSDDWIRISRSERQDWMNQLDTSNIENYHKSFASQRRRFESEVIGRFSEQLTPINPQSRIWKSSDNWTGWEVEMDVFPEVVAGGILLVPVDIEQTKPRPVVVCVHGLEGKPEDTIEGDHRAYHDFAAKLCEQGFIVFCPQQLYLGHDRFRVLQRKANPLGKTLFSIMIPQHKQIIAFLKSLPYVDGDKIGFYGLSYGGKSAMRIPAVIEDYAAVICSGDFNEWVLKNASTRDPFSYVWTPEYEIFEFDLAGTFNYAEMAALICPRPFMVERGHFDAVAIDPWVAFEYAKVRYLYAAKLKIPERTEIEWFDGPHTIHGDKTFAFLRRHLLDQ